MKSGAGLTEIRSRNDIITDRTAQRIYKPPEPQDDNRSFVVLCLSPSSLPLLAVRSFRRYSGEGIFVRSLRAGVRDRRDVGGSPHMISEHNVIDSGNNEKKLGSNRNIDYVW